MVDTPVDQRVQFRQEGSVARLHLNRPEAGNAVDDGMFSDLIRHLEALHNSNETKVLILSGEGADFCLGRDRKPPAGTPTALGMREGLRRIVRLNTLLATLPIPTIAAVQGKAYGMGAGLTVHCDLTVASEDASIAFPEMHHDLPPTIVLSYLGRYLPPKRLFEMIAEGNPLDAATAKDWGLFNRVVPRDELLSAASETAAGLAARSSVALRTLKQFILETPQLTDRTRYELGINVLANVATSGDVGLYDR